MKALSVIALFLAATCETPPAPPPDPPEPPAPVPVDDGGAPDPEPAGDVYDRACSNEAKLGCPEGDDPNCAVVFRKAVAERITIATESTAVCIASAKTMEQVRQCGFAECR